MYLVSFIKQGKLVEMATPSFNTAREFHRIINARSQRCRVFYKHRGMVEMLTAYELA